MPKPLQTDHMKTMRVVYRIFQFRTVFHVFHQVGFAEEKSWA